MDYPLVDRLIIVGVELYPLGDNYYVYTKVNYPLVGRLILVGVEPYPLGDNY